MFGDVGQARTKAAMLILMIDTTSSRTCTKPTVEPTPSVNFTDRIKVRSYGFIKINYDAKKTSTAK